MVKEDELKTDKLIAEFFDYALNLMVSNVIYTSIKCEIIMEFTGYNIVLIISIFFNSICV